MRPMRCFAAFVICLLVLAPLPAQKQKREPLTEKETEQIAEAGHAFAMPVVGS